MSSVTASNNNPTWIIDAPAEGTRDLKLFLAEARIFAELSRTKSKFLKEQQDKVVTICRTLINGQCSPIDSSAALENFKKSEPAAAGNTLRKLLVSLSSSKTAITRSQSREIFEILKVIDLARVSPTAIRRRRQTVPARPKSDSGNSGSEFNTSGSTCIVDGAGSTWSSHKATSFLSVEGFSALFAKRASSHRLSSPVSSVTSHSHGRSSLTTAVAAKPESAQNLALALFGDANMPIADEHPGSYTRSADVVKTHKHFVQFVAEVADDRTEIQLKKLSSIKNVVMFKLHFALWIANGVLRMTDSRRIDSQSVMTLQKVKANVYSVACGNSETAEPRGFLFVAPDHINVFVGENASAEDKPIVAVIRNSTERCLDIQSSGDSVGSIELESERILTLKLEERIYDNCLQFQGEYLFVFAGIACAIADECTK
ncbi:hypothetical protein HDU82_007966 [Entophlyctis luteolus]|nr:hypothetical protein HDU82_007966 [Entophlyctis luteolus]